MFDEALDAAHKKLVRCLELLWKKYIDDPANYTFGSIHHHHHHINNSDGDASRPMTESGNELVALKQRQLGTYREFWVNTKTNISQWTRPYRPRTFRTHDLEMACFVDILIHKDVFPKR